MQKKIHLILMFLCLASCSQAAWVPPIGIPTPSFGIEETYRIYDTGADPNVRNGDLTYSDSPDAGVYTHYVDNDDGSATDTDNDYGTEAVPRLTFPAIELVPGSVVEIHGTTYDYGTHITMTGFGTSASPIFVRGVDDPNTPYFEGFLFPEGTYLIVEGLSASGCLVMGEDGGTRDSNYVSFRANDIYPPDANTGGSLGVLGEYGIEEDAQRADNIVIYNNISHGFGDVNSMEDDDWGQIHVSYYSNDVWIIDNEVYGSTGGGVGIDGGTYDPPILCERIYVGRNYIHDTRAYGLWIKHGNDIVFSQNKIHNVSNKPNWLEEGKGMGYQYWPQDVWYIFNDVSGCVQGYAGSTSTTFYQSPNSPGPPQIYLIGNLIYGYVEPNHDGWRTLDWCGIASGGRSTHYIIGNTIHGYQSGMRLKDKDSYTIINNIIMDSNVASWKNLYVETEVEPNSVVENTLFYQTVGSVELRWGTLYTGDMDVLRSETSTGQGCIVGDPLFTNIDANDFTLQAESPGIDTGKSDGIVATVYALYLSTFGVDIRKDIEGTSRVGKMWDIGAYEAAGGGSSIRHFFAKNSFLTKGAKQ